MVQHGTCVRREKVKCEITRVDDFTRRTSVARDVRKRKSFYLDIFLLVLALPFVRSHREVEFRLDIVHICKGAQEARKLKSVSVTDKSHAREKLRAAKLSRSRVNLTYPIPHPWLSSIICHVSFLWISGKPATRTSKHEIQPESSGPSRRKRASVVSSLLAPSTGCACATTDRENGTHARFSAPFFQLSRKEWQTNNIC